MVRLMSTNACIWWFRVPWKAVEPPTASSCYPRRFGSLSEREGGKIMEGETNFLANRPPGNNCGGEHTFALLFPCMLNPILAIYLGGKERGIRGRWEPGIVYCVFYDLRMAERVGSIPGTKHESPTRGRALFL